MANRHLARSIVLQTLFEWDTTHASDEEALAILARNVIEFGGDDTDQPFIEKLLRGVLTKKEDVAAAIKEAIATPNVVIMDFVVEPEENVYPMVPAGEALNRMLGGMA